MKPIIRILILTAAAVLMASCMVYRSVPTTTTVYSTTYRYIENPAEQRAILRAYYPQLYNYYEEGLLQIVSMRERIYPNGRRDWDIKRRYVKRYITSDREQMYILERYYPDVFARARRGEVRINKMYGYVDNSGRIRYKVDYSRIRNPKPQPVPPAPRYEPAPAHTPAGRPGNAPGNTVRPANPPANGSGNNVRPGNNDRPTNPPANNVRPGNNDRPTNPPANPQGSNTRPGNNEQRPANPPANAQGSNARRENNDRPANARTEARQGNSDRPANARTEARRETTERSANAPANARQGSNERPANARRGGVVSNNNRNEEQKVEEKKEENK